MEHFLDFSNSHWICLLAFLDLLQTEINIFPSPFINFN